MSDSMSLSTDEAEDHYYNDHVAVQEVSQHRWYTKRLVVLKYDEDGSLWGFYYLDPATEMQEDQDRFEADPVPLFPVAAKEIVTTVYERGEISKPLDSEA